MKNPRHATDTTIEDAMKATAQDDQQDASIKHTAYRIGLYRESLIEAGIPRDEAAEMALAFADLLWRMFFGLDA